MPQTVEVEGFGLVEFPDEATPEAIKAVLDRDFLPRMRQQARITRGQQAAAAPVPDANWEGVKGAGNALSSAAGSVVQGGVSALTSPLKLAGAIADRIRANVPAAARGPQLTTGGEQSALSALAESINERAGKLAPSDPEVEQTFFGGTVPQGLGNAAAMLGVGGAAGLAAKAAGRAASPAAVAGATTLGYTAEFDDAFQRAVQDGQDPDTALAKSLGYAGVAAAIENKLGMGRVLKKYFKSAPEAAQALTARGVSKEFLKDALAGYGEEASQRVAQDLIIEGKTDFKGAHEEGAAGSIIQSLMGLPALNRPALPKKGTSERGQQNAEGQPPVPADVTPPPAPKLDAAALKAALEGNRLKPVESGKLRVERPESKPSTLNPQPSTSEPLRFRAIVEEGKVPSELVIQPLTEELYDAVIHVQGLTDDFDTFKAQHPEATHLKRQLLPTGKFANGYKFGPLNEMVPQGIGSKWEDITSAPSSTPQPAPDLQPQAAPAPSVAVSPAPQVPVSPSPAALASPAGDSLPQQLTPPAAKPTVATAAGQVAETITGHDERTGSGMPAEVEGAPTIPTPVPQPKSPQPKGLAAFQARFEAGRSPDLIDALDQFVGGKGSKISPSLIREANPNWRPVGAARRLFSAQGRPADSVLNGFTYDGPKFGLAQDTPLDQFGDAINEAANARSNARKQFAREERAAKELVQQAEQFQQRVVEGKVPAKDRAQMVEMNVSSLLEGDQFEAQGFKFTVQEISYDDDGRMESVTLKDGPKFGIQRVDPDGTEFIHVDKGSFVRKPGAGPAAPAAEGGVFEPGAAYGEDGLTLEERGRSKKGDARQSAQQEFSFIAQRVLGADATGAVEPGGGVGGQPDGQRSFAPLTGRVHLGLEGAVNSLRATRLLARSISEDLIQFGGTDIVGKFVYSARDLALLAQTFRHPQFEVCHWIFTKGGEVVGRYAVSLRAVGETRLLMPKDSVDTMRETMQALGADQYWLLHNHPTADVTPSSADILTTIKTSVQVPGFAGHVVIDHLRFAFISDKGNTYVDDLPERNLIRDHTRLPLDEVSKDFQGAQVTTPESFAVLAKKIQRHVTDGAVALFYLDNRNKTVALGEAPASAFTSWTDNHAALGEIEDVMRHQGAVMVAAYYNGPQEIWQKMLPVAWGLVEKNRFVDFAHDRGQSIYSTRTDFGMGWQPKPTRNPAERFAEEDPKYRAAVNRELNELKAKPNRTAVENARITSLENELGQQDLFAVETRDAEQIDRETQQRRDKAELERRRAERLTAAPIEVQDNLFGEPLADKTGQGMFFSRGTPHLLGNLHNGQVQGQPAGGTLTHFRAGLERGSRWRFKDGVVEWTTLDEREGTQEEQQASVEGFLEKRGQSVVSHRFYGESDWGSAHSRGLGAGVSVEAAQSRADELTAKWVLPFGVEVVQSWRDLPARARRGITEQDGHTVEGRYVPGSGVFLVADNLASPDRVAAVVLHEVLGHFGIDTVLREQRDAFMLDVFRSFQGKPLFQQKVRDYAGDFENGRTPVTPADKILLGRELVAALAENPAENPGIWQRIVDAVRRWLRDIGWVQDVTEADIREALRRADRELRGVRSVELGVRSPGLVNLGGGVLMTPGAQLVDVRPDALAALTAHHGTPHKVDKFSTEKIGTGEGAQVYGWGLYFAENEQVAEEYRKQLSGWVRVDGKPVTFDTSPRSVAQREVVSEMLGGWPAQKAIGRAKEILETRLNKAHKEVEAYRRAVGQFAEGWGNLTTTLDDVKLEEQKAGEIEAAIRELETFRPEQFTTDPGNRYTVTLNVEPEDLLDWDKPLSEQSEKVRKAFEQELTGLKWQRDEWPQSGFSIVNSQGKFVLSRPTEREARTDTLDGATLYKVVTQEETPQKATEKLLTRGVKGIRYLDQGSRRAVQLIPPSETVHGLWLVKEIPNGDVLYRGSDEAAAREAFRKFEQEKTYNYVIFNEDDIRITHENGQPVAAAAFSRTTQPTEPLADLLARRDEAAARGITYTAQREKLRADGKTIPDSLKKAEREQADIFKEASFQLLRHPDYVAQQVRAVDAKLDELNTLKERQRILKQQGTDLESDARARLAELEHWLPIETGEEAVPFQHADEFAGIPPSLVKQAIERTPGLKHFVTEADKKRMRAILDNPNLTQAQKDKALEDLERNRGRQLAEVPLPNALPPRANVALATSTTLAGNQDARGWWESFARYARNLASATPEIPLFGPLARLNVPMRGFLNAIRAGNMTAARDAETMVRDVVQPLLDLPRAQLDPNALARHQAIAKKLQFAERQFDQQAERMRAEIAAMEQARSDRAAITERREALAEFEGNPPAKIAELQKQLAEAVNNLGTNPMWLFKQAVLFRDYVSRYQMLAPKQQGRFKFPGNLSIQDVVNELARTEEAIEASPARAAIKEAMDRHYRAMTELEGELLKRGHLIPEAMKNGAYFPHQVLDYTSQHLGRLKPATEAPFRGYLVDPTGSRKAIETDYIQAVYRHAAEVRAHNAHQDAAEKFIKPLDRSESIRETVEAKAAAEGRTAGRFEWRSEDNLPPGFVFYDAAKKLPLRLGYVLDPQTIAQALGIALKDGDVVQQMQKLGVDFVVEPEMLQQALVAGEKQPWVIPKEVAEALDGILDRQRQEEASARAPFVRRLRQAVSLWKLNTLFAPWHYLRYEWGNTLSDVVDKLGGADLGMAKYLPQAFKEVIAFADKQGETKDIRAAFEQRVLDTVTFAEVEKVKDSPAFEQLRSDTQRALATAGNFAKGATFPAIPIIRLLSGANVRSTVELSRLREATFRYAKFLADLDRIRNGQNPVYAGAYWKDVEAEGTPEEKAALIARRTFGDYGDLSVSGEWLRKNLVPFYSWTEINFRYHANLLRNMADMIRQGEFGSAAQSAWAVAAWTALRLALPYAAVHLWNTVGGAMAGAWDDDDDLEATLSEADRRRFHLILGKDERGQTRVVYLPTAFSDVVSWFGGDNAARLLAEYARGDITFERVVGDFAKQIGPDTLNKVAQSTGPVGKGAFIAISGKQPFPDITNMRSVAGREKWFAVVQTMTDREGTDLLRRAFDNDYYPRPAGEVAKQLILQIRRRDPEQWAFYEVKEKVSDWKERKTGKRFEAGDYSAPEAQALRNFRRAVYLGDADAAERFYTKLLGYGYTSERLKASIRNQHPLAELNEEGRREFVRSLSRADREQLRRALQYWERLGTLKGKERGLFPAKAGQRFTPQPERLQRAVQDFDRKSDEEVRRQAERLVESALTGRR